MKAKPIQIEALSKQLQSIYKAALIYGTDFSVVTDCTERIRHIVLPNPSEFSVIKVNKSQLKETPSLLLDEGNAISLLSDKKIIWLKDADNTLTDHIETYMNNIQTDTFLLINADNLLKTAALRVYAEEHPQILTIACYEDSESDTKAFIQNTLRSKDYTVSDTVLTLLCARLNENRMIIRNEIDKLITYLGDKKEITVSDVEPIIPDIKTAGIESLCFAVSGGNQTKTDKEIQILLANGETPAGIIRLLTLHFNKLLQGADMLSRHQSSDLITKKLLRANQYMLKETLMSQIYLWPKDYLIRTLLLLAETEEQTRNNALPPELILQRVLTMISGLARKLKRR